MRSLARSYLSALLIALFAGQTCLAEDNLRAVASTISTLAYNFLTTAVNLEQNQFLVYSRPDDAYNHGDPGGFFCGGPNTTANLNLMSIDTGCHFNLTSPNGCSTDSTSTDPLVMRITIPPMSAGNFCGISFTEPPDFGTGNAYNLQGSTQVTFQAMSPTNLKVAFGMGGGTVSYVAVPTTWTPMTVNLNAISPPANLASTNILWTVVTNDTNAPSGGTVYISQIAYTPVPTSQKTALGLPLGYTTHNILPISALFQNVFIQVPPDQLYRNGAPTTDVSMAALAFLRRRNTNDIAAATLILNSLDYALAHPNHGMPLPTAADGSRGLYNCYSAGDIALLNARGAANAGDSRPCGYSVGTAFQVFLNGGSVTSNSWAMLAFLNGYTFLNNAQYLADAQTIGSWIYGTMLDPRSDGYGGYFQGYVDGAQTMLPVKWTSGNALIYPAFHNLAAALRTSGNSAAAAQWEQRATIAGNFVQSMIGPSGQFYQGTAPVGELQDLTVGVQPNGTVKGNDALNIFDSLESNTLAALALASVPAYSALNWAETMNWITAESKQINLNNQSFSGFNIVKTANVPLNNNVPAGPDGIGWQYTAEAVVALDFVQSLYPGSSTASFSSQASNYLAQIRLAQQNATYTDGSSLVAASLNQATQPYYECISTPFGCIPARPSLAASAFAIFAEQGFNPLVIPPIVSTGGVTNGASFTPAPNNPIASGTIFSIFGGNLAFASAGAALVGGQLPLVVQGTGVQINGVCAPLFFVSSGQINAQAPSSLGTSGTASVVVVNGAIGNDCTSGTPSNAVTFPLAPVSPGLFTVQSGQGIVAGSNAVTGAPISASAPIPIGGIATIYGTGFGPTNPAQTAGVPATGAASLVNAIQVKIGGVSVPSSDISYAGAAPNYVGLYQFNITIPSGVPSGLQPIQITVGGGSTQGNATIPIAQ